MQTNPFSRFLARTAPFLLFFVLTLLLQPLPAQSQEIRPLDLLLNFQLPESLGGPANGPDSSSHQLESSAADVVSDFNLPSWSRVVFQSFRDNHWDIFISTPDWLEQSKLVEGAALNIHPAVERGGQRLLFISNRRKRDRLSLQLMTIADGNSYSLTEGGSMDSYPSWAPDNYRIAFTSDRDNNIDVYLVNADKSGLHPLTTDPGYDGQPSWSPDGTQIVFTSNRSGSFAIWRMNADGTAQTQLTFAWPALFPAWSPLGDKIAFSADSDGNGFLELWQMDANGANFIKLVENAWGSDTWQPTWSPDGRALGYQVTNWQQQNGSWVWINSYMMIYHPDESPQHAVGDSWLWRPQWVTLDNSPPGICTPKAATQQRMASFFVSLNAADVGPAGTNAYQVEARANNATHWQLISPLTEGSTILYSATSGESMEFRCRARDAAGNWAHWTDQPTANTTLDVTLPLSAVTVASTNVRGNQVDVHWHGSDLDSAIDGYDIWQREGNGRWQKWQHNVKTTAATFTGDSGKRYEFRSQARDQFGNQEPWQPSAQASVLFYASTLTTTVSDNRGNPAIVSSIDLSPAPAEMIVLTPTTTVHMYLGADPIHELIMHTANSTDAPTASIATEQDSTFHYVLPPEDNLIVNGGFEHELAEGWLLTRGEATRTADSYFDAAAAMIQHQERSSTALEQTLTLREPIYQPTLSWMQKSLVEPDGGGLLVQVRTAFSTTSIAHVGAEATGSNQAQWRHRWIDLNAFRGEQITVTFALSDSVGTILLDNITVGSWRTPVPLSVAPTTWRSNAPTTLTITGTNFMTTPTVYVGNIRVDDVILMSPHQLLATLPRTLHSGMYDLVVVNPDGLGGSLPQALQIDAQEILLPTVMRMRPTQRTTAIPADWPMLGQNLQRTGYNAADPGGSNYVPAWQTGSLATEGQTRLTLTAAGDTLVATMNHLDVSIIAFDATTGQIRWRKTLPNKHGVSVASIAHSSLYYVVNNHNHDSYLFVADLHTGEERWRFPLHTQWQYDASPVVWGEQVFVYGGYTGGLHGINAGSGIEQWFNYVQNYEERALALADGSLYANSRDGLYRVSPATGSTTLLNPYEGYNRFYNYPVIYDQLAIVDNQVAINRHTGEVVWQEGSQSPDAIGVVDENGVLYRASDNAVQAMDARSGSHLWSVPTFNSAWNVSAGAGNYIYINTPSETYIIDRRTHEIVQELDRSGVAIVANGYLYIATTDLQIHAYRAEQP